MGSQLNKLLYKFTKMVKHMDMEAHATHLDQRGQNSDRDKGQEKENGQGKGQEEAGSLRTKLERIKRDAQKVRELILSMDEPFIIHHYDADGISAGSIVYDTLIKAGKKPKIEMYEGLAEEDVSNIAREHEEVVIVDLGSHVENLDEIKSVAIIDHHQPNEHAKKQEGFFNPWQYGIDGTVSASSSTMAWFVFRNRTYLSLVGAAGDVQTPFEGLNRYILENNKDIFDVRFDLTLYGRESRDLITFFTNNYEYYMEGLTGNRNGVRSFLRAIGISDSEMRKSYEALAEEKKAKIRRELVKLLIYTEKTEYIENIFGEVYTIKADVPRKDVREYATLLNACGRYKLGRMGRSIALNEPFDEKSLTRLLNRHKKNVRAGIEFAKNIFKDTGQLVIIDGRGNIDYSIIGIVCGALQYKWPSKLVLGLANKNDVVKISMRGSFERQAINIGQLLSEVAEEVGGSGGGHIKAGGAEIPKHKVQEFIEAVERRVREVTEEKTKGEAESNNRR